MAIRGGSYSSDIAIDDITVSPGTCKPIGRNNYKGETSYVLLIMDH